jgi:hypothetical protein
MGVTFLYRAHYAGPSEKLVRRFDEDTSVLAWFQRNWSELSGDEDSARENAKRILGVRPYGFSLGEAIREHALPPPQDMDTLARYIGEHGYIEEVRFSEHALEIATDDDELELAFYWFDDIWLAENPDSTSSGGLGSPPALRAPPNFFTTDDWRLPSVVAPTKAELVRFEWSHGVELPDAGFNDGTTYFLSLAYFDSANLVDLPGPTIVRGTRLPDFPRWLAAQSEPSEAFPLELQLLRSQLFAPPAALASAVQPLLSEIVARNPDPNALSVYKDLLEQRDGRPGHVVLLEHAFARCAEMDVLEFANGETSVALSGTIAEAAEEASQVERSRFASKSLWAIDAHMAQLCLATDGGPADNTQFHQWIVFDDLWASSYPELARSLLTFASTWRLRLSDAQEEDR